jgi:hypothetical protein
MKFYFCCLFTVLASLASIKKARAGSVLLSWEPSSSPGVIGYDVYYGTSPGNFPYMVNAGGSTSVTLAGLSPGVTYYFVATAYDSLGRHSAWSAPASFRVPETLTMVTAPGPGRAALLRFPVQPGRRYEVLAASDGMTWKVIWQSGSASGSGWMECADTNATAYATRFYRVIPR